MRVPTKLVFLTLGLCAVGLCLAQIRPYRRIDSDRNGTPTWEVDKDFRKDHFTFVRVQYQSWGGERFGRRGRGFGRDGGFDGYARGRWAIDFPDSDLNFSFRLQQMTSLKVEPNGKILQLTDPELFHYPWIYIVEPGGLLFSDDEVPILRRYLLNGGFLMVDDFWGQVEWDNFYQQIKRVFPDREPKELSLEHPIFHCVFDLKTKPQIPNYQQGIRSQYDGVTWEEYHAGGNTREVHFRAIFDDRERMMVIICHNTDLGDGWEREGTDEYFFHEFSEKKAYPLGINIVFYAMTH